MANLDLERVTGIAREAACAPSRPIADAARNQTFDVEIKADGSHLTEVDIQAERMVRSVLSEAGYPEGAAVIGEEQGEEEGSAPWRWIIDPIDGTHPFSRDIPVYSTLVALENRETGAIVSGVAHLPGLNETFWAWRGGGAWRNGRAIRVSKRTELYETMLSTGSPYQYRQSGVEHLHRRLFDATKDLRVFGDVYAHMAAARGSIDAVFDPDLSLWDFAPSKVIVEEAGGKVMVRETGRGRGHDVLLGAPVIVDQLAELLEFYGP